MRTDPPFADTAIAYAEKVRDCSRIFAAAQLRSPNQSFKSVEFDGSETNLSPRQPATSEERDRAVFCPRGECKCRNQSRAQHRIFGGDPTDVAKSIIAMCEGMHLLWLTSPESVDLQYDTLAGFRTILAAITPRG